MKDVTVITVTRRRPQKLRTAIDTVNAQCCAHVARHLIVVDDCDETTQFLAGINYPRTNYIQVRRGINEQSGVHRLSILRDIGAANADSEWVAYLDDDNTWAQQHLHHLLETVSTGVDAAHSWRQVIREDGSPYTFSLYPWGRDLRDRKRRFWERVGKGSLSPGSNVYRDGIFTEVDSGEWLLSSELLKSVKWECSVNETEVLDRVGEDDKLLEKLKQRDTSFACSQVATLIYNLGGESNSGHGRL